MTTFSTTSTTGTMDRRSLLRGSVTIAGAAVALPTMASLGACSPSAASIDGQLDLLAALVESVIPETDTPGAISAGVPAYVAAVFDEHLTAEQQNAFASGLKEIGKIGFLSAKPDKQETILAGLGETDEGDAAGDTWRQLREMAIFGFYTSEAATQELAYEEIPGRYDACVPVEEVGRAWLARGT